MPPSAKRLIVCADDFGLDPAVNEAVARASRHGILTCTSIMMGMPAMADAVARAKDLPELKVGLHVTLTAGRAVLPPATIPDLVDADGYFDNSMARAGVRYFFLPRVQRQLRAEIRAQFEAFAATGLALDHVNTHRHFHLHPTLAVMINAIGREFGMKAMRIPYEPLSVLRHAARHENRTVSMPLYMPWVWLLRRYMRGQKLAINDAILGLAWSGGMTETRVAHLIEALPAGVTELYFHPAVERTPALVHAMPNYRHVDEFDALMSPRLREQIARQGIELISYSDLSLAA